MTYKVFVFGSNLAGRHGKGAAKYAHEERGAIYFQGQGPQGQSYAIPTKGKQLERLSVAQIGGYVREFVRYAQANPGLTFEVTPIGTGQAGHHPRDIAPLFRDCLHLPNVELPERFLVYLNGTYQ